MPCTAAMRYPLTEMASTVPKAGSTVTTLPPRSTKSANSGAGVSVAGWGPQAALANAAGRTAANRVGKADFLDRGTRLSHEATFAPGDRSLVGLRQRLVCIRESAPPSGH